jgi:ATP-dependent helicase Lhr and Lhr-like helicase
MMDGVTAALDGFSPATRAWFAGAFDAPTPAQEGAWRAISAGEHALVVAPTGSGKTLSAFLWALDQLASTTPPAETKRRSRHYSVVDNRLHPQVQSNYYEGCEYIDHGVCGCG